MSHQNLFWHTATGRRRRITKIGHQHLSNILWFREIVNEIKSDLVHRALKDQLLIRYGGKRLPWKPLPIPEEIEYLRSKGYIIGTDIVYKGQLVGSIRHIKQHI